MTEEKTGYTVEEMQAAIEADKQQRVDEFAAIMQREAQRLRVNVAATVEAVPLGNGVFGSRAVLQIVAL